MKTTLVATYGNKQSIKVIYIYGGPSLCYPVDYNNPVGLHIVTLELGSKTSEICKIPTVAYESLRS